MTGQAIPARPLCTIVHNLPNRTHQRHQLRTLVLTSSWIRSFSLRLRDRLWPGRPLRTPRRKKRDVRWSSVSQAVLAPARVVFLLRGGRAQGCQQGHFIASLGLHIKLPKLWEYFVQNRTSHLPL